MMFTFEPIGYGGHIKLTNKSLKWNRLDQQLADKEYIVCYMPNDMVTITMPGIKISDKDECIEFLRKEISAYELWKQYKQNIILWTPIHYPCISDNQCTSTKCVTWCNKLFMISYLWVIWPLTNFAWLLLLFINWIRFLIIKCISSLEKSNNCKCGTNSDSLSY